MAEQHIGMQLFLKGAMFRPICYESWSCTGVMYWCHVLVSLTGVMWCSSGHLRYTKPTHPSDLRKWPSHR